MNLENIKYNTVRTVNDTADDTADGESQYKNKRTEPFNYWIKIEDDFPVDEKTYEDVLNRLKKGNIKNVKMNGVFQFYFPNLPEDHEYHSQNLKDKIKFGHWRIMNLRCTAVQYDDMFFKNDENGNEIRGVLYDIIEAIRSKMRGYMISIGPDLFDYDGEEYTS
jgi:hypothetical protein